MIAAAIGIVTRVGSVGGFVGRFTQRLGPGFSISLLTGLAAWLLVVILFSGAQHILRC